MQTQRSIVDRRRGRPAHLSGAADRVRARPAARRCGARTAPSTSTSSRGSRWSSLGHAHPAPIEAFARQAATLGHVSNLFWTEPGVALAERLLELCELDGGAFFCNSGAEANEAAIKLARRRGRARGGPDKHQHRLPRGLVPRPHARHAAGHLGAREEGAVRAAAGGLRARAARTTATRCGPPSTRHHRGGPARAGAGRGRRARRWTPASWRWRASCATATTRC